MSTKKLNYFKEYKMKIQVDGVLSGVDYQKSGEYQGRPYPSKILLKFGWDKEVEKEMGLKSITTGTFTVTVPLDNGESLQVELQKYNNLINKELSIDVYDFEYWQGGKNNLQVKATNNSLNTKVVKPAGTKS